MPTHNTEASGRTKQSFSTLPKTMLDAGDFRRPPCPVCDETLRPTRRAWVSLCPSCGYLAADLSVKTRERRESGLRPLRQRNFEHILDRLDAVSHGRRGRLLDVGCAHGWFLEAARARGFEAYGIEPDPEVCALAQSKNLDVWPGFFPNDIPGDATFDVITFNDVFEHLPDPAEVLRTCCRRLAPGGFVVINIPSSLGAFYRLAAGLDRLGLSGPFERMWQKNFSSPHLFYVTPDQLDRLTLRAGLVALHGSTLPSVEAAGLWTRLRYDKGGSLAMAAAVWLLVMAALPILRLLPADIILGIYGKPAAT